MNFNQLFSRHFKCEEEQWISVSDLMAGLMIIFLFIAITYIRPMQAVSNNVQAIVSTYENLHEQLYQALMNEFRDDLPRWRAVIDKPSLSVRFESPDILFDHAEATLKPRFRKILLDFFPRYAQVLWRFHRHIEEIRIEGHTSSKWAGAISWDEAYINNMRLSQRRTIKVLAFGLALPSIKPFKTWLVKKLTANGLSSSQLVMENGIENSELSRRVEFRVRTNARDHILRIGETTR